MAFKLRLLNKHSYALVIRIVSSTAIFLGVAIKKGLAILGDRGVIRVVALALLSALTSTMVTCPRRLPNTLFERASQ